MNQRGRKNLDRWVICQRCYKIRQDERHQELKLEKYDRRDNWAQCQNITDFTCQKLKKKSRSVFIFCQLLGWILIWFMWCLLSLMLLFSRNKQINMNIYTEILETEWGLPQCSTVCFTVRNLYIAFYMHDWQT